jgi:hypothetical protein
MKDSTDLHIQGLEMEGGYHGHPYPQHFIHAPKSQFPDKSPHKSMDVPNTHAMKISMGK